MFQLFILSQFGKGNKIKKYNFQRDFQELKFPVWLDVWSGWEGPRSNSKAANISESSIYLWLT